MLKRNKQMKLRVDENEYEIILKKSKIAQLNLNEYLRKMSIDGYIIKQDLSSINNLANEINKIGCNVNQITKLANEQGGINKSEIIIVQKQVDKIWQLLKCTLLKAP